MEIYNYVVITKEDCMTQPDTENTGQLPSGFNKDILSSMLTQYGQEGYRVITTLYNSPHDWVLVLSRAKVKRVGRLG